MEAKTTGRVSACNRVSERPVKNIVCRYWLEGRCNKNPCSFVHKKLPPPQTERLPHLAPSSDRHRKQPRNLTWKNPNIQSSTSSNRGRSNSKRETATLRSETETSSDTHPKQLRNLMWKNSNIQSPTSSNGGRSNNKSDLTVQETAPLRSEPEKTGVHKGQPKQCEYWITGNCVHGDKCKDLHSWFSGSGYTMLAKLEGHAKAITGISLPSGGDKLYSGGKDGIVRVWDCNNGQSAGSVTMDSEVGCLVAEGQWLFAGVQNGVKVWDLQNHTEYLLNGPAGLVCNMVMDDDYVKLFAGMEDGTILVWKWHPETKKFEPAAMLKEHKGAVCSLVIGAGKLYSSSTDSTIKVWDLQNLQCLQTLHGHTKDVTSILCWESYLISGSLDNTLKVWAATESGTIEMVYEIKEDYGVIALCGTYNAEAKPILLSLFSDSTVRLYDLPSFTERGRIFSKHEVHTIQIGVDGLFFTGDATGEVCVWKLLREACATPSEEAKCC